MNYKDIIFGKVKADNSLTDKTLIKNLKKEGHELTEDMFNKTLLDLEILGLINVSWVAKDTRKIEIASKYEEDDEVDDGEADDAGRTRRRRSARQRRRLIGI